jgi:hypothetical protein
LRLYRRATRDGNPRQLTSEAPATPYGLNGALSNPFANRKALHRRLSELKNKLLARAVGGDRSFRRVGYGVYELDR